MFVFKCSLCNIVLFGQIDGHCDEVDESWREFIETRMILINTLNVNCFPIAVRCFNLSHQRCPDR